MKKLSTLLLLFIFFANSFCNSANNSNLIPANEVDTTIKNIYANADFKKQALTDSNCKGKRIYLTKGSDNGIYLSGTNFSYKPGDTLVLKASQNPYTYFSIDNFYGNENCPVTIINEGGQVNLSNGMAIDNCRYVRISGEGFTTEKYGFKIEDPNSSGVGIDIHGRSSYIEIKNIFIHKKTYGFWVKQEGNCADSLQFPNWIINNIYIHDNLITKMNQEGMYLGSTDPNGLRDVSCNGSIIHPKPLRLGNIKVYNNIVDSTNRSGIQLSCGSGLLNEIYNNKITNCGFEFNTDQGNGISLGGYTRAVVHDNYINHTYGLGIMSLGSGKIVIDNNKIDNSGEVGGKQANGMAGIMIDTRGTSPVDSTNFIIYNNTIGKNSDYSIRVYKTVDTYNKNNIICNNSGNVNIDKKVDWKKCDDNKKQP